MGVDCTYIIPPALLNFLEEKVRAHGAGIAGALCGAGWCCWVDAVLVNAQHGKTIPFMSYVPGIIAFLAMLLMCAVRKYEPAPITRQRLWLFFAYVVSFGSIIGAYVLLIGHVGHEGSMPYEQWIGWAAVLQVTCILGSGLILFISRGENDGYADGGYTAF